MFKKPVRIKSNSQVKGSERKAVKDLFCQHFPDVPETDVNALLNNKKEPLNCIKLVTHSNDVVQVYTVQKQPILFHVKERLLPTVFLLWKFPDMLPCFITHPQVMTFITSGANLMLPGVQTPPTGAKYGNAAKEDPVYVGLSDNKAAVAVGVASQSSFDMERANGKGKCVDIYHFFGDHLCNVEGKFVGSIPSPGPPSWLALNGVYETDFPTLSAVEVSRKDGIQNEDTMANTNTITEVVEEEDIAKEAANGNDDDDEGDMDELLHYCFLASIKYSKTLNLPVLISNFFKLQMLPMCPEGATLDIKKTSYKKLKPFLDDMAKIDLITIKEIKKGVEAITSINTQHPKFNEFYLKPENRPKKNDNEDSKKTVLTESYIITQNVLPLFQNAEYRKGDLIEGPNIRKLVTEYIKQNDCIVADSDKLIQPATPVLKTICKTENPVTWEEVFERVCESMKSCFKVTSGDVQVFNKGKVSPIIMGVAKRSGNKKVTLVDNLEAFGINIQEFAKECQHGVAASTSITPTPPGKKCDQLLVQGNQVVFIHNLLVEKYKIPKKYIRGLELAPKKKK